MADAVVVAIIGLVGVVIGGVLTGIVSPVIIARFEKNKTLWSIKRELFTKTYTPLRKSILGFNGENIVNKVALPEIGKGLPKAEAIIQKWELSDTYSTLKMIAEFIQNNTIIDPQLMGHYKAVLDEQLQDFVKYKKIITLEKELPKKTKALFLYIVERYDQLANELIKHSLV